MITLCPEGDNPIVIETESLKRGGGKPRLEAFTSLSRKNYFIHDGHESKTFSMAMNSQEKSVVDTIYEWYTEARLCVLSIEDEKGNPETHSVVIEDYSYDDDGEFFDCTLSLVECDGVVEVEQ
mgnify:CR=1 FL=1